MSDLTGTPAAEATPVCAGQLELFRPLGRHVLISSARPDGGPLVDEDRMSATRLTAPTHQPRPREATPMPLSVPLLLVPGDPDRYYTVHTQRARWDDAKLAQHGTRGVSALMEAAREGLRYVSECIAAELADADVTVIQHPDGSAEAVARVLCTEDSCTAFAERYHRDADEDIEAEAARKWAATKLQDQTVELLRRHGELDKTTWLTADGK